MMNGHTFFLEVDELDKNLIVLSSPNTGKIQSSFERI